MPWSEDGETFFTGVGAAWATYNGSRRWEWMVIAWRQRQAFVDESVFRRLFDNGHNYDIVAEDVTMDQALALVTSTIEEMEEAVHEEGGGYLGGLDSGAGQSAVHADRGQQGQRRGLDR
jgi:hypothetical protein